eukprot:CAMPEP_0117678012 /NCGR_PEP_ID=MMETSP0804-20121206/17050_1 /TAXON_ID=1074897 /ORGANISM="Tetraselmis astigmatica, Strain CCMP880" /LENGTH=110 /DNA_ID=CAMNT_0005487331 /DNA_START=485 /DNA_END=818 /DNA_ORIENTATION=+
MARPGQLTLDEQIKCTALYYLRHRLEVGADELELRLGRIPLVLPHPLEQRWVSECRLKRLVAVDVDDVLEYQRGVDVVEAAGVKHPRGASCRESGVEERQVTVFQSFVAP